LTPEVEVDVVLSPSLCGGDPPPVLLRCGTFSAFGKSGTFESIGHSDMCTQRTCSSVGEITTSTGRLQRVLGLNAIRSRAWKEKVVELCERGMQLIDLMEFYIQLFTVMPHFDPERSTTRDVVRAAIIPMSKQGSTDSCALATSINAGCARVPDKMVTHHWENRFAHTVAAILADAFGEPCYAGLVEHLRSQETATAFLEERLLGTEAGQIVYWFCPFSVNQHASICEGWAPGAPPERDIVLDEVYPLCDCGTEKHFEGDLCEMNKFSEMMAKLGEDNDDFGHVIAVDESFDIFNRAWCIGEVVQGRRDGLHQVLKIPSVDVVRNNRKKLESLDVRNCRATRAEDKECILASIENVDAFNKELKSLFLEPEIGLLDDWSYSVRQAVGAITSTSSTYLFHWPRFTGEYRSKISRPSAGGWSTTHPLLQLLWMLGLAMVPLICTLSLLSLPYSRPDAGLEENWVHVGIAFPSFGLVCYSFIPQWVQVATKVLLPRRCTILWPVVAAVLTAVPIPAISKATDTYPVPLAPLTASVTYIFVLPILWALVPAVVKSRPEFGSRFCWAVVCQVIMTTLFCICYPLLDAWVQPADDCWHLSGLVMIFLLVRIFFEKICEAISRKLHPDVLPATVFIAELAYQCALSIAFGHIRRWVVVITLICYSIIENSYYLICFLKLQNKREAANDDDSISSPYSEPVAAVLLLRQLVGLMTPALFIVLFAVLPWSPSASYNYWVDEMTEERLRRTLVFLFTKLCVELVVGVVTVFKLRAHGLRPLRFLYGVICAGGFGYYLSASASALMWYASLQLVHSGCDYSLEFEWTKGATTWVHGFTWD